MVDTAAQILARELVNRRESINSELRRNGVRFGIYKNGEYKDRLFPYDPIPRVIDADAFANLESQAACQGVERILAGHLFRQAHCQ